MGGVLAIALALLSFLVPMAVPLFAMRWRTLLIIIGGGVLFFGWMTLEMSTPGTIPSAIGAFLGGLMLFGFAAGVVARSVGLLGRRPDAADDGGSPDGQPRESSRDPAGSKDGSSGQARG